MAHPAPTSGVTRTGRTGGDLRGTGVVIPVEGNLRDVLVDGRQLGADDRVEDGAEQLLCFRQLGFALVITSVLQFDDRGRQQNAAVLYGLSKAVHRSLALL